MCRLSGICRVRDRKEKSKRRKDKEKIKKEEKIKNKKLVNGDYSFLLGGHMNGGKR